MLDDLESRQIGVTSLGIIGGLLVLLALVVVACDNPEPEITSEPTNPTSGQTPGSASTPMSAIETGDCWGGALSAEAMHCYVIEQAETEGVLEVEELYDDGGGALYIFFNYLQEFDSWSSMELGQYFVVKGSELVKRRPDQALYVPDYTFWSSRMVPQSIPYNVIILRTGGAEARLQMGGWASWTQVWPKVPDRTVQYVPDSFDVSEVDVTGFPELDCVEQQRLILRITSCDMSRRFPELGIAGWHGEGRTKFVQVKAPPGEEANIDAAREEFVRRYGVEISEGLVIIPVKYDFEELWRWTVVLNRFAVSAGNTIGIGGAKVSPNIGISETLFPLDNLRPTVYEGSDQTRETIRVWGVDEQRIAESLPVLLPQLGIPIDAVGMIKRYRNEPPGVIQPDPARAVQPGTDPASSDVVGSMSGATQNDEEEGAGEAELSVPSSNVTLNDVSNDSPMSMGREARLLSGHCSPCRMHFGCHLGSSRQIRLKA